MFKKLRFLVGFGFVFLLATMAHAQEPVVEHSDPLSSLPGGSAWFRILGSDRF